MDLFDRKLYIGVVGSRRRDERTDYHMVLLAFLRLIQATPATPPIVVISGGCPHGADRFAEVIAREYDLKLLLYRPDRRAHPGVAEPWRSTRQNYDRNELMSLADELQVMVEDGRLPLCLEGRNWRDYAGHPYAAAPPDAFDTVSWRWWRWCRMWFDVTYVRMQAFDRDFDVADEESWHD